MKLSEKNKKKIGKLKKIIGTAPNSWKKYSIHIIEPIIDIVGERNTIEKIKVKRLNNITSCQVNWMDGLITEFITTGEKKTKISINYVGVDSSCKSVFFDPYSCFKKSLEVFCIGAIKRKRMFNKSKLFKILKIIEMGLN